MSKVSDEGEKDRLTSEEFVDLIPHLPFANILEIEYFSEGWKRLIVSVENSSKRLYRCNLCKLILSGQKPVFSHITGKKHIGNMGSENSFFHPEYTFSKAQLRKPTEQAETKELNKSSEGVVASKSSTVQKEQSENSSTTKLVENKSVSNGKSMQENKKETVSVSGQKTMKSSQTTETRKIGNQIEKGFGKESIENKSSEETVEKGNQKTTEKSNEKSFTLTGKNPGEAKSSNSEMEKFGGKLNKNSDENSLTPDNKLTLANSKGAPKNFNSESPANQKQQICLERSGKSQMHPTKSETAPKISVIPVEQLLRPEIKNITEGKSRVEDTKTEKNLEIKSRSGNQAQKQRVLNPAAVSSVNDRKPKIQESKSSDSTGKKPSANTSQSFNVMKKNEKNAPKRSEESKNPENSPKLLADKTSTLRTETSEKESINEKCLNNQKSIFQKSLPKKDSEAFEKEPQKYVKNPLAAKKSTSRVCENLSNQSVENKPVADIIVIDDNEDGKEAEPAAKKQKVSLPNSEKGGNKKPNKEPVTSESSIPTKARLSPTKNKESSVIPTRLTRLSPTKKKESSIREPAFAVRSITETTSNEEICGFVGVEYVIKICRSGFASRYECGLCELILDGEAMQKHLLAYNHRLKFCEKHFPTAIQQFRQYIVNVPADEHYKIMIPVLQKLSVAIEEHHGRSLPFDCEERRYNSERHRVLTEVFARRHASEQRGPTFTHVVDAKEVDEFILKRDSTKQQTNQNTMVLDRPQGGNFSNQKNFLPFDYSSNFNHNFIHYEARPMQVAVTHQQPYEENTFLDDETHKRMVDNFLKATSKSNFSQHKSSRSSRNDRDLRQMHPLKRSHSPLRTSFGSNKDLNSSLNVWSSYCRVVDNKLKALEESFRLYKVNPESHPSYKNEWLKFWHRRKSELMSMGRDYRTYDYQPDWVPYFNNRINELYDEAFEKLKIEAREELSLPMKNEYLRDPKYFVHVQTDDFGPAIKKMPVSTIGSQMNASVIASQRKLVSSSQNSNGERYNTSITNPTKQLIQASESKTNPNEKIEVRDESEPTVVSVLRLLTALEEYLGSLGPKIVELLSKALQAEKTHQGRAHVLLTEDNCTLLETAMEKFKGLVIAGILDSPKERAVKKAISKVNDLLEYTKEIKEKHQIDKRIEPEEITLESNSTGLSSKIIAEKSSTQDINEKLKQAVQSVSNANDISKVIHLIEEKIAASLKAQGRTDVDRAHLEQLAAVCVLLDKKKQEASNTANKNLGLRKPSFQQPLSDALKKIVGSLSTSSTEQDSETRMEHSKQAVSGALEARRMDNKSSLNSRMQGHNLIGNVGELDNFMYAGKSQGNFSNVYSKNDNQLRSRDASEFGENSQQRPWQQNLHHQQPQRIPSLSGWSQNTNLPWGATERPSLSGVDSQWNDNQNNFGQMQQFQNQFRYN